MKTGATSSVQHFGQRLSVRNGIKFAAAAAVFFCATAVVLILTNSYGGHQQLPQQHGSSPPQWRLRAAANCMPLLSHGQTIQDAAAAPTASKSEADQTPPRREATGTWTAADSTLVGNVTEWQCLLDGAGARSHSSVHAVSSATCTLSRFAVIILITGFEMMAVQLEGQAAFNYAWLSIANKRAYTEKHGYALYIVPDKGLVPPERQAPWAKFVAAKAVMAARPHHEWLMVIDADAFIMNLDVQLSELTRMAEDIARLEMRTADVIAAKDCNAINSGSIMFRNSVWAQHHLSELYSTNGSDVSNVDVWWENAALIHIYKERHEVREHYVLLSQNLINAYSGTCEAELKYKEGMFVLHFAGGQKPLMHAFLAKVPIDRQWLGHVNDSMQATPNSTAQSTPGGSGSQMQQLQQPVQHRTCVQVLLPVGSRFLLEGDALEPKHQHSSGGMAAGAGHAAKFAPSAGQDGAECFTSKHNLRGLNATGIWNQTVVNDTITQVVFVDSSLGSPISLQNKGWPLRPPINHTHYA